MRRIINKLILIILLIVVFFSGFKIADYYYEAYKQKQLFNTVEDKIDKDQKGKTKVNGKQIQKKYLELFKENNDFVGWIKIKDTKINYPISAQSRKRNLTALSAKSISPYFERMMPLFLTDCMKVSS